MTFLPYLQNHIESCPYVCEQDILKFCFQAVFGAEHLLRDREAAFAWTVSETESAPDCGQALYEELCDRYCRVNLAAWKKAGYPSGDLAELFVHAEPSGLGENDFRDALQQAGELLVNLRGKEVSERWNSYLQTYWSDGLHPVHHSEPYRDNMHPHYRVIRTDCLLSYLQTHK